MLAVATQPSTRQLADSLQVKNRGSCVLTEHGANVGNELSLSPITCTRMIEGRNPEEAKTVPLSQRHNNKM